MPGRQSCSCGTSRGKFRGSNCGKRLKLSAPCARCEAARCLDALDGSLLGGSRIAVEVRTNQTDPNSIRRARAAIRFKRDEALAAFTEAGSAAADFGVGAEGAVSAPRQGRAWAVDKRIQPAGRLFKSVEIALNAELARRTSATAVLEFWDCRGRDFSAMNFATALHRIGAFAQPEEGLGTFQSLTLAAGDCVLRDAARWTPRQLADAAWGAANVDRDRSLYLFRAVGAESSKRIAEFDAPELADLAWAFATARIPGPTFFNLVATAAMAKLDAFDAPALAKTAWAFAKAGLGETALFENVAEKALAQMRHFDAAALSDVAWAFYTAGVEHPPLFQAVAMEAVKKMETFSPQQLTNTCWTFSMANHPAPEFFAAAEHQASPKLVDFGARNLAKFAWALWKAGAGPELLKDISAVITPGLDQCAPQHVANLVRALASTANTRPKQNLFRAVSVQVLVKVRRFEASALADVAFSFAVSGFESGRLFETIATATVKQLHKLDAAAISNLLWAFAQAGYAAPDLFEAAASAACEKVFPPKHAADLLWAYARAGASSEPYAHKLFAAVARDVHGFHPRDLAKVIWASGQAGFPAAFRAGIHGAAVGNVGLLPPVRRSAGERAVLFVKNLKKETTASDLRSLVSACSAVHRVRLGMDRETGFGRGFGFVTIDRAASEIVRVHLDGLKVHGKRISVEIAPREAAEAPQRRASKFKAENRSAAVALSRAKSASIALNRRIQETQTSQGLLELFAARGHDFDNVNLATTLHRLGALRGAVDEPRVRQLVQAAATSISATFWKPRELSSACWGVAKLGKVDAPAFFEAVALAAPSTMADFHAQEISNTAWAFAKAGLTSPALFAAFAAQIAVKAHDFNAQALSNTAWAFATVGCDVETATELWGALDFEISKRSGECNAQAIANVSWAFAKAGATSKTHAGLLDALAEAARTKMAAFTSQNLANTVWAFATAGHAAPELFEAAAEAASKKMASFTPQELTNVAWSYATAGVEAPSLFEAVATESTKKLASFSAQHLANHAWAFAKAKAPAPAFFAAVAQASLEKMEYFISQDLANTAWAFSTAGVEAPALYASIAAKVLENPQSCTPQHLANLAWAFAVSGAEAPFLFEALAEQTLLKKEAFQPQHLARTLRAISSVQRLDASFEPHPPGKHALALFESIDHVKWFDARSLASVAWAFSRAGISNLKLFNAIAEQVPRHLDAFQARDVSDLAWAFGKLADASEIGGIEPLFEKLAQASVDKLYLFKPHSLARLVGAFADLGLSSPALFQAVSAACNRIDAFSPAEIKMVVRSFAAAKIPPPNRFAEYVQPVQVYDAAEDAKWRKVLEETEARHRGGAEKW